MLGLIEEMVPRSDPNGKVIPVTVIVPAPASVCKRTLEDHGYEASQLVLKRSPKTRHPSRWAISKIRQPRHRYLRESPFHDQVISDYEVGAEIKVDMFAANETVTGFQNQGTRLHRRDETPRLPPMQSSETNPSVPAPLASAPSLPASSRVRNCPGSTATPVSVRHRGLCKWTRTRFDHGERRRPRTPQFPVTIHKEH